MAQLSKWFVVLALVALLPAAGLLGGSIGEVMRHPSLGSGEILRHASLVILLAVLATFLLQTASGLHEQRRWALLAGMAETLLLIGLGLVLVVGNAGLLARIGVPQIFGLGAIMAGLGALVAGARLLRSLWGSVDLALPFGRADLRALGTLGVVVVVATLGHLVVTGIAT